MGRANDTVRTMLDHAGVPWRETISGNTAWDDAEGNDVAVTKEADGMLRVSAWFFPEQIVNATVRIDEVTR